MDLSFFYQNVRGLKSKLTTIYKNSLLSEHNVLCLTETWLNSTIFNPEVICDRYNVYRRDREDSASTKTEGGGCLIAVDKNLTSYVQELWASDAEDLWVTIVPEDGNLKCHIGCVYLPPNDTIAIHSFCSKLNDIFSQNSNDVIVLCGDFNQPYIKWVYDNVIKLCKPTNYSDPNSSLLIDSTSFVGLSQFSYYTNHSGNTLDLIFGNNFKINNLNICSTPLVPEDKYHCTLEFSVDIGKSKIAHKLQPSHNKFNFKKAKFDEINNCLLAIDWDLMFLNLNVEQCTSTFYLILNNFINYYIPKNSSFYRKFPPWFSFSTIKVIREKKKYHTKWKKFNNNIDYLTFKILRGRSKHLIDEDYRKFVSECEEHFIDNPKHLWRFVNTKRKTPASINTIMHNNIIINDSQLICDSFSEYFSSVFITPRNIQPPILNQENNIIPLYKINKQKIKDKILSLPDKPAGPDNIPSILIKKCMEGLLQPLFLIFNRSLQEGTFPQVWKKAFIIPIPKAGDNKYIENYRPISKLPILSKIFEGIIKDFLYFDVKNLINIEQHGFLKHRSVETNLVLYSEYILKHLNSRIQVDAVYTDFSKAFDKISHDIMLNRLAEVGVHGSLLNWFESYLTGRLQAVSIGSCVSKFQLVTSGVPQGSHLGPLLFNVYINNISKCFKFGKFLMYADDLKVYHSIESFEDSVLLQEDITRLESFCRNNSLFLNFKKCYHISFSRNKTIFQNNYTLLGNQRIATVNQIKDLGVIFDSKMLFDQHIYYISKKANRMLGFISRICFDFKNPFTLRSLFMAYINSILSYCSVIWNPQYNIYINKLASIQNRFVKLVNKKCFNNNLNSNIICQRLNLSSLVDRRMIADTKLIFKIVNNLIDSPALLSNLYYTVPTYNTRIKNIFHINSSHTNYYLNSPLNRCLKTCNNLCNLSGVDVFSCSLNSFSTKLKLYIASSSSRY